VTAEGEISFTAACPLLLTEVHLATADGVVRVPPSLWCGAMDRPRVGPFSVRWARAGARFLVPVPRERTGYLCVFLAGPRALPDAATIRLSAEEALRPRGRQLQSGEWQWCVWSLESLGLRDGKAWVTVHTDRPFDPQRRGYPADLAATLGHAAVVGAR